MRYLTNSLCTQPILMYLGQLEPRGMYARQCVAFQRTVDNNFDIQKKATLLCLPRHLKSKCRSQGLMSSYKGCNLSASLAKCRINPSSEV